MNAPLHFAKYFGIFLWAGLVFASCLENSRAQTRQTEDLDALLRELAKASREERLDDARGLCGQVLSRDVVGDFLARGTEPATNAMEQLLTQEELGSRVEAWKEELAKHPNSERLNFLLAMAGICAERANVKNRGWTNYHLPIFLRIRREGSKFSGEVQSKGRWEKIESVVISMPRTALAGFCGSGAAGTFRISSLTAGGRPVSQPEWRQTQISRPSTAGVFEDREGKIRITGAGNKFELDPADDIFFAYSELKGDLTLEVVLEEADWKNGEGAVGLMIRGSLEPGASYVALMAASRDNAVGFWFRTEPSETGRYLTALCALRPHDAAFVTACLDLMLSNGVNEGAYQAAERLLKADPKAFLGNTELFQRISWANNKDLPLPEVLEKGASEEERIQLGQSLLEQARAAQSESQNERAVALWQKAEKLLPGGQLPLVESQQFMISLKKLKRFDELKAVLKGIFLGQTRRELGLPLSPSERILFEVSLSDPGLVPDIMPLFAFAAENGIASQIAGDLGKFQGNREQKGAAQAVALVLRLAAQDPALISSIRKAGAAYAQSLPQGIPEAGLALLAYQLQQSAAGRPAAMSIIKKLSEGSRFDPTSLLLWRARIADLQGKDPASEQEEFIVRLIRSENQCNSLALSEGMQFLLKNGRIKEAEKLAQNYQAQASNKRPEENPFRQDSDALSLLDLYQGKGMPMPVVWAVPAGDEAEVHWEFAPNNWGLTPSRETRAYGESIPAQAGRYDLEIYAVSGPYFSQDLPADECIAKFPGAASSGSWTGKMPPHRRWLVGVLKDKAGKTIVSPAVPALFGKNLLSPLDLESVLKKEGDWSSFSRLFWGAGKSAAFPRNILFVSRLQSYVGTIPFDYKPIPIGSDRDYIFSAWMRTPNGQQEKAGYNGYFADAGVAVAFFDGQDKQVAEWHEVPQVGNHWTLLAQHFSPVAKAGVKPLPPQARSAKVRVWVRTQCEVGDIGFYEIPKESVPSAP